MADTPIDVVLVDDSAVIRALTARGLAGDAEIRVVGAAADGAQALALLDTVAPHVVVLDVEMPVMDGLAALPKILAKRPGARVIMASALTRRHAALSLKALSLGAADYVPKPEAAGGAAAQAAFFAELRAKIKALGCAEPRSRVTPLTTPKPLRHIAPTAIAIGSSTGGPTALMRIFARLKGRRTPPIFITQHMPPTFTALLAETIGQTTGAPAFEAQEGMRVAPNSVYVAPGGLHMLAARTPAGVTLHLSDAPPENFCRPAVDPMLRSLAKAYGSGLLAIILTGMGRDGAEGCIAVADAGGAFLVQDEASSVVYGMPGAAYRTGRALAQLPLEDIAIHLANSMERAR